MRPTLLRILKTGVPTALILALFGYGMAQFAGLYIETRLAPRPADAAAGSPGATPAEVRDSMSLRLPLLMGGGGFAVIAVLEMLLTLLRGERPAAGATARVAAAPNADGLDPEVEKLLNQLLEQAEATRAGETVAKAG